MHDGARAHAHSPRIQEENVMRKNRKSFAMRLMRNHMKYVCMCVCVASQTMNWMSRMHRVACSAISRSSSTRFFGCLRTLLYVVCGTRNGSYVSSSSTASFTGGWLTYAIYLVTQWCAWCLPYATHGVLFCVLAVKITNAIYANIVPSIIVFLSLLTLMLWCLAAAVAGTDCTSRKG